MKPQKACSSLGIRRNEAWKMESGCLKDKLNKHINHSFLFKYILSNWSMRTGSQGTHGKSDWHACYCSMWFMKPCDLETQVMYSLINRQITQHSTSLPEHALMDAPKNESPCLGSEKTRYPRLIIIPTKKRNFAFGVISWIGECSLASPRIAVSIRSRTQPTHNSLNCLTDASPFVCLEISFVRSPGRWFWRWHWVWRLSWFRKCDHSSQSLSVCNGPEESQMWSCRSLTQVQEYQAIGLMLIRICHIFPNKKPHLTKLCGAERDFRSNMFFGG